MENIKIQGIAKIKTVSHGQQYDDNNPVQPGDLGVVEAPHPSTGFWYLQIKGCRIWFAESDLIPIETIVVDGETFIELNPGESIEPGFVLRKDGLGVDFYTFYRVTKLKSFVRWSAAADGRFPRVYTGSFRPVGFGLSTVKYKVFKPFDHEPNKQK